MSVVTEVLFLTFGLICTGLIALTGVLCVNLSFSEDSLLIGGRGNWGIAKGVFSWPPGRFALGTTGGGGDSSIALFLMRERERESTDNHTHEGCYLGGGGGPGLAEGKATSGGGS